MSGLTFYDKDEKDINRLLAVAEESLCARLKALKGQEGDADKKKELEVVNALLARLRFARVCETHLLSRSRIVTDFLICRAGSSRCDCSPTASSTRPTRRCRR